jgi:hypothetical protein
MTGRKADNPADPGLAARAEKPAVVDLLLRHAGEKGAEVIVEDVRLRVGRIPCPLRPFIARAEIAAGIIVGAASRRNSFRLPLPRPFGSVRGDEYPFSGQEVQPSVGML